MIISESIVTALFEIKTINKWDDEFFLTIISKCHVPRESLSTYFDLCVLRGEMTALEKMDNIADIRAQVMEADLSTPERKQLGKCIAFLENLKQKK